MRVRPVILSGGSGSRLWPLSRSRHPKQLLALTSGRTMLQDTVERLQGLTVERANPLVICNESQRFLVIEQLQLLGISPELVLEPAGRNTAPAVTMAALQAEVAGRGEELQLILPADHVIEDHQALAAAVQQAVSLAKDGALVTFGVVPKSPETGYGYIRADANGVVQEFVEKPGLATAQRYVQSGDYYWNSGMFLFSATSWLESMAEHAPDILAVCRESLERGENSDGMLRPAAEEFLNCRADSVDYAVMEKTVLARVVPLSAGWSDVGSWKSAHDIAEHDSNGNAVVGDALTIDCRNTYVRSESRLTTAVGLEGCIVVETKDAVLVVPRDKSQDVKKLVDAMAREQRPEVDLGREVFRPWGSYDSLDAQPGYQVKRLTVLPGAILSLQLHHHRAEHWVVVSGVARITRDDEVFELNKNEHTFIPVESKHRIENPGAEPLQIIEVQVGDYLGEDDIVRFSDRYGREGRTD